MYTKLGQIKSKTNIYVTGIQCVKLM